MNQTTRIVPINFVFPPDPPKKSAYQIHGILKSLVHFSLINNFHIDECIRPGIQDYFILHWQGEFILSKIQNGCITLGSGVEYSVIWKSGICASDLRRNPYIQCRLSFRSAKVEYGLPNYVMIARGKE